MAEERSKAPGARSGRRTGESGSLLEPRHDPEEPAERRPGEDADRERYLVERPPHHDPR